MATVKEEMKQIIDSMPEDATYSEILRELAFKQMVDNGLQDVQDDHVISNQEMKERIRKWQK